MAGLRPPDNRIEEPIPQLSSDNNQHLKMTNRHESVQSYNSQETNIEDQCSTPQTRNLNIENQSSTRQAKKVSYSTISNRVPEFRRKKIHSRNDLIEGDQVSWHRFWGFWHHAIFINYAPEGKHTHLN